MTGFVLDVSVALAWCFHDEATPAHSAEFIAMVETLSIEIDQETPYRAFGEILALARGQGLTAYDAAYLELAMRSGVPLAAKDLALAAGARSLGVEVIGA